MEDLIKRSDATETVYKALRTPPPKGTLTDTMSLAVALVQDIPSADRPQGEWIDNGDRYFRCSLCGTKDTDRWHWCHGCGHPMKGADDEDN